MVSYNCRQIEEMIIKQSTDSLTRREIQSIELHIANCTSCHAFYLSVMKIKDEISAENNELLKPDPAIQENIHQLMEAKPVFIKSKLINIITVLHAIFEFRIPVYQAILVGILIFIIIFNFDFFRPLNDNINTEPEVAQSIENTGNDIFMVENHPVLSEQKVGVNAREDSILIRYIHTSM